MEDVEIFNGIVLPDGRRVKFSKEPSHVKVADIKIKNHPAFKRGISKQLLASDMIPKGTYIGSYGGQICPIDDESDVVWNPYKITPKDCKYDIDGETIGNEMRYINDPRGWQNNGPNVNFHISWKKLRGHYTVEIRANRDIQIGEEILADYGDGYWEGLQQWDEKRRPHKCPNCDYRCQYPSGLIKHLATENPPEVLFHCEDCDKKYSTLQALRNHKASHIDKIYECDQCDNSFASYSGFRRHVDTEHLNLRYKCFECDEIFTQLGALKLHSMAIHENRKPFKCDMCEYATVTSSRLQQHKDSVHYNKRAHKCTECESAFNFAGILANHIKNVHEGQRRYPCQQCEYVATESGSLKRHIEGVHEKKRPYKCPHCEYAGTQKISLTKHILAVHEKKKLFKCPHCELTSSNKANLDKHIKRKHTGPPKIDTRKRPFPCPECEYAATAKQVLDRHILAKHRMEKPFVCQYCGLATAQKGNLDIHIRRKHENKRSREDDELEDMKSVSKPNKTTKTISGDN